MKLAVSLLMLCICASGATLDTLVESTAMPWLSVDRGLNDSFQFGANDGTGPTIVDSNNGVNVVPGGSLIITYSSGFVSTCIGCPDVDANGWVASVPTNVGNSQELAPSAYIASASIPLMALVGVFANNQGTIVGSPFFIGDGPYTAFIPTGVTRLQLGVNDNYFTDNSGFLRVKVSNSSITGVPEPASLALVILGITAASATRWKRKAKLVRA